MKDPRLKIVAKSERDVVITREFDAPRALVFEAHTKPELVRRWLGVFGGWTFLECTIDLRVGGRYRYLWQGPEGERLGLSGTYTDVVTPERYAGTEAFDESWYPGTAVGTTTFEERGGRTLMTNTMTYSSKAARDAVMKSPMEQGLGASYMALDAVLASGRGSGKLTPFLMFNDQLERAIEFYTATFPDSRVVSCSRSKGGPATSAEFVVCGQRFIGFNGGPHFSFSDGFSLMVSCEDQAEVDLYWDRILKAGGKAVQCGWIHDAFGVRWQIVPRRFMEMIGDQDAKKVQAAMQAMMKMVKFDIAALEQAFAAI